MKRWLLGLAVALLLAGGASADEPLRVGKAVPHAYSFTPLDVAQAKGFFKANGIEVEILNFMGAAKMHQAMAAGALDIGVGAGPDMAFVSKGAPEIAVAAMAGPPLLLGIIVPWDSPAKSAADLKGKKIGVSTVGSLSYWTALELSRTQGWGPDGVTPVAIGGDLAGEIAALRTHQVDAVVDAAAIGFQLEAQKTGRLLLPVSDFVQDFITHAIFASNQMVKDHPDKIRAFLKAWFETIAWMRANRDETIEIVRKATTLSPEVEAREYDMVTPMFSANGRFEPKALDVLKRSLVTLNLVDGTPDMAKLYTEQFLPAK